jgi:hypothetical protein
MLRISRPLEASAIVSCLFAPSAWLHEGKSNALQISTIARCVKANPADFSGQLMVFTFRPLCLLFSVFHITSGQTPSRAI